MGNISLMSLARFLRKLEGFRSSAVPRKIIKLQRQSTRLQSNVYKRCKPNFSFYNYPHFFPKIITVKLIYLY